MSKPMRRFAAVVATVALSATMSACTQGHWVYNSPPAAGVQVDQGGLKLRNVLVVADTDGQGIVLGGIASRDQATEVTGITVAAGGKDGSFGQPQQIALREKINKGATIYLLGATTKFSDRGLKLGLLADVTVKFSTGQLVSLEVPVMSSKHPDFAKAFADATS